MSKRRNYSSDFKAADARKAIEGSATITARAGLRGASETAYAGEARQAPAFCLMPSITVPDAASVQQ